MGTMYNNWLYLFLLDCYMMSGTHSQDMLSTPKLTTSFLSEESQERIVNVNDLLEPNELRTRISYVISTLKPDG